MEIYPAIDIKGGRVVRMLEGARVAEHGYGADPLAQASEFVADGARWLHVVDMDRAFRTGDDNSEWIRRICGGGNVAVQVGGDIASVEWARDAVSAGASRIVLGTRAVLDPELLAMLVRDIGPGRAAVAVDVRDGRVALRDRDEPLAVMVSELVERARDVAVRTVVYRDIGRDGMLVGPDLEGAGVLAEQGVEVIVAGGVGGLSDLEAARALGVAGVIVGRALHEGRFTLQQAIACLQ